MDSSSINPSLPIDAEPPEGAPRKVVAPTAPAFVDRLRLRFRKGGDLRFLSHHDLLRSFERLLRRCALPFHNTRGFHPHPRLVFALSLPLGVEGLDEIADLELDEILPEDDVLDRLRRQAPPGLEILSARRVPLKSSLQVSSLCYRLDVPTERIDDVRRRIDEVMTSDAIRLTRIKPKAGAHAMHGRSADGDGTSIDVRPFLRGLNLTTEGDPPRTALEIELWLTPAGTAKPAEVLGLLGLTDLLESGVLIQRTRLELNETNDGKSECRKSC